MTTVGDLIREKDYDQIEYYLVVPEWINGGSMFIGVACSVGGKLISLDGDSYDEDEEVVEWSEWSNPEAGIINGLKVVVG